MSEPTAPPPVVESPDEEALDRIVADLKLSDEASYIAILLNDHAYVPSGLRGVSRCACGLACHGMPHEWRNHVAEVLATQVAERERRAAEQALTEAADAIAGSNIPEHFNSYDAQAAEQWLRARAALAATRPDAQEPSGG